MTQASHRRYASIIPSLRYRDAPTAIEWLGAAFGFESQLVVPGEQEGTVMHSQLRLGDGGNGMIMVATVRDEEPGGKVLVPGEIGHSTQGLYVIVEDPDAHCARARAAGARIVREPEDQPYGGRLYTCADPEGHVWNFGSYDPFAGS